MRLTTALAFDAAHRILGHPGGCAYLHGHAYHLEVTVGAETLDRLGMVMDFDDPRILWPLQSPGCRRRRRKRWCAFLETLPSNFWRGRQAIGQGLPSSIVLECVVIRETPTCAAEISHDA